MSDSALFIASALPWMRNVDEDQAREIFERMDSLLRRSDPALDITVRADNVSNSRHEWVVTGAEQLARWDTRPPTEVFRYGFMPRVAPESMDDFRALDDVPVHLYRYVYDNVQSVFVSTTRFVQQDGRESGWYPAMTRNRYQYEIYAYGGIDIQLTFHVHHISPYYAQQEITFIGGIRPGLIRSARQYDDSGRVVRVWRNLHFNPLLNGEHAPRAMDLPRLPDIVDTANFLMVDPPDDVGEDTGHDELFQSVDPPTDDTGHDELKRETSDGDDAAEGNGNFGDYQLTEDPWAADDVNTFRLARACLRMGTGDQGLAYFFADTRFVRVNIANNNDVTDTMGEGGVQLIVEALPALHKVQFPTVDAAIPVPGYDDEVYFFCNEKYCRINIKTNAVVTEARTIVDYWLSLKEAGFTTVDAGLTIGKKAYFFRGSQYIRVLINPGSYDELEVPPKPIVDGWQSLKDAGFDSVDAALRSTRDDNEVYFFKGDKYAKIIANWGMSPPPLFTLTATDRRMCETDNGTDTLAFPTEIVKEHWPSLVEAKFY